VLIDTPPVLPVTDATVLARFADATLMVIAAGTTTKKQARRAVAILERVDAAPLGVIVNRIPHRGGNFYYGYGYDYRYGRRTSERSKGEPDGPASEGASRPEPGEGALLGPGGKEDERRRLGHAGQGRRARRSGIT
jgi:Mrp family chromosome partitioning ATPase